MAIRVYPSEARRLDEVADERLGFAAGDGDEAAFEVLFRRHQPAVLAFCRHMLGRADEAQDATQHTFLAAYRVLRRGEPIGSVRSWLFTVARNRCVSMLRARREHHPYELAEPVVDGLAAEVLQRADVRALLRDVADLPEDQRAALLLAELADLPHGEIADVIGVRREKVKALVFQARASLLAAKDARETPCHDVRQELATARGAALRRAPLRRHLHACPGCREFRDQLRDQRRALRALLPVVPPLRDISLGAAAQSSAGAGTAVGLKAFVAKVAIGVTLAGGAGGTALVAPSVVPGDGDGASSRSSTPASGAASATPANGAALSRSSTRASGTYAGVGSGGLAGSGEGVARDGSPAPAERNTLVVRRDRTSATGETRRGDTAGDQTAAAGDQTAAAGDRGAAAGDRGGAGDDGAKTTAPKSKGHTLEGTRSRGLAQARTKSRGPAKARGGPAKSRRPAPATTPARPPQAGGTKPPGATKPSGATKPRGAPQPARSKSDSAPATTGTPRGGGTSPAPAPSATSRGGGTTPEQAEAGATGPDVPPRNSPDSEKVVAKTR